MRNYRQWLVFSKVILTLLGLTGWYGPAQAAVNIDRTRIIFASDEVAQSLTLSNDNTTPMLLQVWTDAGNIDASPDNSKTPLVALPPVFKMQPGELRTLRLLLSSRQQLATDRESLFWLNIYQIPPVTQDIKNHPRKLVFTASFEAKNFNSPDWAKSAHGSGGEKITLYC
ncbi:fimbrial assembly chaperone StbE [Salmonella enterica subsp. enterica serovar Daytona]|uniref:Fimbrial assembly chaperone StbE n=1 Tax=Salmonella enterica subsp. enterica serovar Daytona TaxID=1962639 RepID=A0A447JMN9_SALET|nr:fimbrial assembly chaperone StbE [Salmonella enterica subsp. enterica serovar Daytona]